MIVTLSMMMMITDFCDTGSAAGGGTRSRLFAGENTQAEKIVGLQIGEETGFFNVVLSRNVDCDVGWRAANLR